MSQYSQIGLSCHSPGRKWAFSRFCNLSCKQSASSLSPLGERELRKKEDEQQRCYFSHSHNGETQKLAVPWRTHTLTSEKQWVISTLQQAQTYSTLIFFHICTGRVIFTWEVTHTHRWCHQMWHVRGPSNSKIKQNYYFMKPYWEEQPAGF